MDKDLINEEDNIKDVTDEVKKIDDNDLRKKEKKKKTKKTKEKKNSTVKVLLVSIIVSFVCGMLGAYLISQTVSVKSVVENITTSELVENSISSSVDKVYSSTVVVIASSNGREISTGTGFIYKKEKGLAYIMTNNHVIDGANSVEVEFNDKPERIKAKIIGGDKYADVAVLTIKDDNYTPVVTTNHDKVKLGDTIFTVGSPMGINYKGTVTKGILSGKDRMVEAGANDYYMKVLQIDAAVNPGNSGGPLCDVSGNVIGIISLKIVKDEVEGMGFAIPIEDALKCAQLIEDGGGEISRPFLGISMLDLTEDFYLWQNKIQLQEDVDEGIAVISVEKGSPASRAGLKKGDIITKINDDDTRTLSEFRYELYKHDVGEKITLTFYRDNKKRTTDVVLGKNNNINN